LCFFFWLTRKALGCNYSARVRRNEKLTQPYTEYS